MKLEEKEHTPEQRAEEYMQNQREIYANLLAGFKDDDAILRQSVDCSEKEAEIERSFKREERKKLDRKLKKDINEWEEMFNGNPALCQSA